MTSTSRSTVATEALAPSSTPSNDDQQPRWSRTTSTINNITNLPAEGSSSKASRDLKVPKLPVVIKIQCCSALHLFTIALNYCYIETTLVFSFTSSDTSAYICISIIKRRERHFTIFYVVSVSACNSIIIENFFRCCRCMIKHQIADFAN